MWKYCNVILLLFTFHCQAMLPPGCVIKTIDTQELILSKQENTLIYIQNKGEDDIYLANQKPTLTSKLSPKMWSVLQVKDLIEPHFSCIESKPGAEQRVTCQDVLRVCHIATVKSSEVAEKTRWLVENDTLENSAEQLIQNNIKVA